MLAPDVYEEELLPFLNERQKLLWAGKPKQGILFSWFDIYLIPFSLIWGCTAIWGVVIAIYKGEIGLILAFIPMLMIAWLLMIGRFFLDRRRRANITYGMTEDSIIVISGIFNKGVRTFKLQELKGITLRLKNKGRGNISLGPTYSRSTQWMELIENAEDVYGKIVELKRGM